MVLPMVIAPSTKRNVHRHMSAINMKNMQN
jgi:hypothetical protein